MTIIPAPPGYASATSRPNVLRGPEPDIKNLHLVGLFDRGDYAQCVSVGDLIQQFGQRVAYSTAFDEALEEFAEGGPGTSVSIARLVGPAAATAKLTRNDGAGTPAPSIRIEAGSVGAWGNALKAEIEEIEEDVSVRVVITETIDGEDIPVAVSPTATSVAELVAWDGNDGIVKVFALGANLPAPAAAASLTGGDDDRAGIATADYATALGKLDARWGPGVVRVSGGYTEAIHGEVLKHCASTGRISYLDLEEDATKAEALEHSLALEADHPEEAFRGVLFGGPWSYAQVLTGQPDRLVPFSATQAGVHARVLGEFGVGTAAFGERRGRARTVSRLSRELTFGYDPPGEIQELYAGHVNAPVDAGAGIQLLGYRTLDRDPRREDGHVATTLMWLQWEGAKIARSYLGEPVDTDTLIAYEQDLDDLCQKLLDKRAIVSQTDDRGVADGGRIVDVRSLNTPQTMLDRHLHGFVRIRPTGSYHWVDLIVGTAATTESLGV